MAVGESIAQTDIVGKTTLGKPSLAKSYTKDHLMNCHGLF